MTDLVKQTCRCGRDFRGNLKALIERGFKEGRCRRCVKLAARRQGVIFFRKQALKLKKERKLMDYVKAILIGSVMLWVGSAKGQTMLHFAGGIARPQVAYVEGRGYVGLAQKFMNLSLQTTPFQKFGVFKMDYGFGIVTESELGQGRSYFVNVSPTVKVKIPSGVYLSASQGVGYLSSHIANLDNHFQFLTHIGLGLTIDTFELGMFFHHISSGRNSAGNQGVNLFGVELGIAL